MADEASWNGSCRVREAVELLFDASARLPESDVKAKVDAFLATVHPAECSPSWKCSAPAPEAAPREAAPAVE